MFRLFVYSFTASGVDSLLQWYHNLHNDSDQDKLVIYLLGGFTRALMGKVFVRWFTASNYK